MMVKTYVFQVLILARNQALISLLYIFQGYCPFTVSGPQGRAGSGVRGVDHGFVWWSPPSGPTAVTFLLLDANVILRLVAGSAEVGK